MYVQKLEKNQIWDASAWSLFDKINLSEQKRSYSFLELKL